MVTVQFNFKTILEAQEFLANQVIDAAAVSLPGSVVTEPKVVAINPEATAFAHTGTQDVLDTPVPAKKKRSPKVKVEKTIDYGVEDCRTALGKLFDAKGRDVAKSALAKFNAARVTELKAEQYIDFITTCEKMSAPE